MLSWWLLASAVLVRGHARVEVLDVRRELQMAHVQGRLRDAELHSGLAGRAIEIRLGDHGRLVAVEKTTAGGRFAAAAAVSGDAVALTVRFPGDRHYLAAIAGPIHLEPSRRSVNLSLDASPEIDLSRGTTFEISARIANHSDLDSVSVPVTLFDGRGREIARLATLPAKIDLDARTLGSPGLTRFEVRFLGNADYAPATVSRDSWLTTPIRISLSAEEARVTSGRPILASGRVSDVTGPVAKAHVTLFARGEAIVSTQTDADGQFAVEVPTERILPGHFILEAQVAADVPWRKSGRSNPLRMRVLAATRWSISHLGWLTAGLALTMLMLGAWPRPRQLAPAERCNVPSEWSWRTRDAPRTEERIPSTRQIALATYRGHVEPHLGDRWRWRTPAEVAFSHPNLRQICDDFEREYFGCLP